MGNVILLVLIVWPLVSLLMWDGPRHMNGYKLIRSSEASWKKGKGKDPYIYLSVYFLNRGNWYYYRTEDLSVRPNDIVVVPWGKYNHPEPAIVGWVEYRRASDVPYPLCRTKTMIRKAGEGYRAAFDEQIRWPLKVNVSERWSRDERGKALRVHNETSERRKLREWIGENPRLQVIEPISELDLERTRFHHDGSWI